MSKKHFLIAILFSFSFIVAVAQKKERYGWGQYTEVGGINYQNYPYTLFNRVEGTPIDSQIANIKRLIINGQKLPLTSNYQNEIADLYNGLYEFAVSPRPDSWKENSRINWAKARAFVRYIGLYKDGTLLDPQARLELAQGAENALKEMITEVPSDPNKLLIPSRKLIAAAQTYDLLKASGYLKDDRNIKGSARNQIRTLARNLYNESSGKFEVLRSPTGYKVNHGVSAAAALGTIAIVMNESGTKNDKFGRYKWAADSWARLAHWGMNNCLFDGEHPIAKRGGIYGDKEGVGYFEYAFFETALPFFITFRNFVPKDHKRNYIPYGGREDPIEVSNYFYDKDIQNIFEWYFRILTPDGSSPNYDNTKYGQKSCFGLFDPTRNVGEETPRLNDDLVDIRADYIAAIGSIGESALLRKIKVGEQVGLENLENSGNFIFRMNTGENSNRHYFHLLNETDFAHNEGDFGGSHEDDDIGSFLLNVDNEPLAIDPGYINYSNVNYTNKYFHHNVIQFNDNESFILGGPINHLNPSDIVKPIKKIGGVTELNDFKAVTLDISRKLSFDRPASTWQLKLQRNVKQIRNPDGFIYYVITDYATGHNNISHITFKLNGNGNILEGISGDSSIKTFQYDTLNGERKFKWIYPCSGLNSYNGKWSLFAHVSVANGNSTPPIINFKTSTDINGTRNLNSKVVLFTGQSNGNTHTQLNVKQNTKKTVFLSVIAPYKCGADSTLPNIVKEERDNSVINKLIFYNKVDTSIYQGLYKKAGINPSQQAITDTIIHLFYSRIDGLIYDSINLPFTANSNVSRIKLNAKSAYLEFHSNDKVNHGYCQPTSINIRHIEVDSGTYIKLNDTILFESSEPVHADIAFLGRRSYNIELRSLTGANLSDSVKILLPEIGNSLKMLVLNGMNELDTIPSRYDTINHRLIFKADTTVLKYSVKEDYDCLDCYFPPLGTNFDTLFLANDGLTHTLGNSKKITNNHGNLSILNSTKVNMCPGVILHNKDSLIIEGPAQKEKKGGSSCAGIDSLIKGSDNSMLIVSPYAALVLDAGSHTYVKKGAGLYIKQNGSLIVKSGALLEVGDSGTGGWGEIIAEPGAFIYIEDNAVISYRRRIGDTSDNNTINFAIGNGGVIAGVQFYIDSILKADSILPTSTYPIAICALDTINPIGNREWGYTNFGRPEAKFFTRSLTLCPKEPFYIKLNRLLNDAQLKITVCRVDSVWRKNQDGNWHWKDTCINDSIVLDSMPPDPSCLAPRVAPEDWLWYFPVNTIHRVHIEVKNECGLLHDTLVEVAVLDSPTITLVAPAQACEGYGTLKAVASINRSGPVHYAFEVTEIPDTTTIVYQLGNPSEEYSFDTVGILPDTFDFPGFYFKGGRKYIVSFTYLNDCGTVTKEQEVEIPTGALITFERPTVYANPVHGARTVQLHGYVNSADSFSWSPPSWLNRTDTLVVISTPGDSISYVLTAYQGNCVAYDTAFIKYNRVANAGLEDTVCYTGSKVVVGNGYDLSVFLGYLYYKGGSDFRDNWFKVKTSSDPAYFKYLSMFMQTNTFKSWAMGAGNLYLHFTEELNREGTLKEPWFSNYFDMLTEFTDPDMYALDTFVTQLSRNTNLAASYNATGNYTNFSSGFSNFFSYYDDFVANYLNTISMMWIKVIGADTSFNSSLQESAIAIDEPLKTSIYIQQVITPDYAEFDETIVYVDTVLEVGFVPQLQIDSTVVFQNITIPTDGISSFSWNFGDGSPTASEVHAFHTFPAFDTLFRVCLTATNECGNYTWCDTVYIDSAHWGGSMFKQKPKASIEKVNAISQDGIEAMLFPNPTEGNCTLSYRIQGEATLVITDAGGRTVWETALPSNRGQQQIPSQNFEAGLYFYHIHSGFGSTQGKFMVQR